MEEVKTEEKKKKKLKPVTIVIIILLALILIFAGYVVYKRYFVKEKSVSLFSPTEKSVAVTVANDLDGTKVAPERANRHPLAIMVENFPDARPQTGLNLASIVYESITEGGITRFMAVYGPNDAPKVGPVRSARTYFVDWAAEFNAFYAHCGGNLDALDKIKADDILDLDQFGLGETAYWREAKAGVATEHTMYTSTDKLYKYAFDTKKWPQEGSFKPLKFTEPATLETRTSGQTITIDFSSPSYLVSWKYDKENNVYLRNLAGVAHKDNLSGQQLSGTNIIIQAVERWNSPTTINESGFAMKTVGTGKALIFSQGKQTTGTWSKTDRTSRTIFLDDKGKEISFIPGQFWVEIVPPDIFDKVKVEQQVGTSTTTTAPSK